MRVALLDLDVGAEYIVSLPLGAIFDRSLPNHDGQEEIKVERVKVKLTRSGDLVSRPHSGLPPYPSTLVHTLGEPTFSDCTLSLADDDNVFIGASKAVLAHASPFFRSMFLGGWRESGGSAIKMQCSASALIVCLLHMYCGWLPGDSIPRTDKLEELFVAHKCKIDMFGLGDWHDVLDTSRMLGRVALTRGANGEMSRILLAEQAELDQDVARLQVALPTWGDLGTTATGSKGDGGLGMDKEE